MKQKQARQGSESGFTLIELLVSLGLLAILSLGIYESLSFGIKAWSRNSEQAKGFAEVAAAQSLLRSTIEAAYPLWIAPSATQGDVAFRGSQHSLSLLAPAPGALGMPGRAHWQFDVTPSRGALSLTVSATHELATKAGELSLEETPVSGIAAFEFAYFGASSHDQEPQWLQTWSDQRSLPLLVRVHAVFPPGDTRQWPEMIVPPRITAEANCVYDALFKDCQEN